MSVTIEHGVPLPEKARRKPRWAHLPWKALQVGDSFVVEHTNAGGIKNAAKKAAGITIHVKQICKGQFRVWRLE